VAALLAVLWSCAAAAAAEPPAVFDPPAAIGTTASGLGVHAAVGVNDFSYEELADDGASLDREDGFIPGVVLGASWRSGAWEVTGELGYSRRDVDYAGKTNAGVPIATQAAEEMRNGALRVRRWLELGGRAVAPYGGLAHHRWDRSIRPTRTASGTPVSGLFEKYAWWTAELGVELPVVSGKRLRGGMDARLVRTLHSTVEVEFPTGLDDASLRLGDRTGYRLGTPWSWALTASTELRLDVYYEAWGFGRSRDEDLTRGGARVGTVHEPRSETRKVGLTVGCRRQF
jgi:hypothetical protein